MGGYRELFDNLPRRSLSEISGVPAVKGVPNPAMPASAQPKVDAERLIRRFLPKAFRRTVPEEIALGGANTISPGSLLRLASVAGLSSPSFTPKLSYSAQHPASAPWR